MKKHLLILSAASLAVCSILSSCSSSGKSGSSAPSLSSSVSSDGEETQASALSETDIQGAYKIDKLDIPELKDHNLNRIEHVSDPDGFILDIYNEKGDSLLYTDADFKEFKKIELEYPEEYLNADEASFYPYINSDGTFIGIAFMTDHGGVKLPDEYDENFDYEGFYDSKNGTNTALLHFDRDGKLISKADIEGLEENDWGDYDIYGIVPCGDHIIAQYTEGKVIKITSDGKIKDIYTPELNNEEYGYTPSGLLTDRDGKIVFMKTEFTKEADPESEYEYNVPHYSLHELDTDKGGIGDAFYDFSDINTENFGADLIKGEGKYRFFIKAGNLMGLTDDGKLETVINWMNSDIDPMEVYPLSDNKFIGSINSYDVEPSTSQLYMLTPRDPSDFVNKKIITIASGGYLPTSKIGEFNRSQSQYRIVAKEYAVDDTNSFEDLLSLDLISGSAPDIICGLEDSYYQNLRKKGAFAELYQFIDKDKNGRDAYLPNVLKALESSDGKLYTIVPDFAVRTIATKSTVWDKENWTMEDMLKLYDEAPASAEHIYDAESKNDIFSLMFYSMGELIDYEKAECHFDSPEFVKMLEFCNRFVDEVPVPDKTDMEAYQAYYSENWHWFANEKKFIEPLIFNDLSAYESLRSIEADGSDITFAGLPSPDGKGGRITTGMPISISSSCEEKEGAWAFIRDYYISEPHYEYDKFDGTFIPIRKSLFEEELNHEMHTNRTASGHPIAPLSQEERDRIEKYILSCEATSLSLDKDVENICYEEAEKFFKGGQTAQQAADMIQNRVSIVISEKS